MVNAWRMCALTGALACLSACADDGDAKSRVVVSISHLASEPVGMVLITDDRTFDFLNWTTKSETRGTLSPAEFDTLQQHVTRSNLDALYEHQDADPNRCELASDGYVLSSIVGTACFVLSAVNDEEARSNVEYFATLYSQKAVRP
jgi:hypothetical protein